VGFTSTALDDDPVIQPMRSGADLAEFLPWNLTVRAGKLPE